MISFITPHWSFCKLDRAIEDIPVSLKSIFVIFLLWIITYFMSLSIFVADRLFDTIFYSSLMMMSSFISLFAVQSFFKKQVNLIKIVNASLGFGLTIYGSTFFLTPIIDLLNLLMFERLNEFHDHMLLLLMLLTFLVLGFLWMFLMELHKVMHGFNFKKRKTFILLMIMFILTTLIDYSLERVWGYCKIESGLFCSESS